MRQVLSDIKTTEGGVTFQTPPSSPSSLGSRKSSMCSISSAGSSSGGSVSTSSPLHQAQSRHRPAQVGHQDHRQLRGAGEITPILITLLEGYACGSHVWKTFNRRSFTLIHFCCVHSVAATQSFSNLANFLQRRGYH